MNYSHLNENGLSTISVEGDQRIESSHRNEVVVLAYFQQREIFARLLGALLLILFSPIIFITALAVKLTSFGPAFFTQRRLGKEGREFSVLKLRTMYMDAEETLGPTLCTPRDSRVTPIGRLLRHLHLDELPQLVNVAKGEMCLVGPRPERPEIIEMNELNERVLGFSQRIKVLPGITGLAQINLPADQTADCVTLKVILDLEYIETASLMLDLRILICTALRMLGFRHEHALKLLGLYRKISLGQETPKNRGSGALRRNRMESLHQSKYGTKNQSTNLQTDVATNNYKPDSITSGEPIYSLETDTDWVVQTNESTMNNNAPKRPR